MIWISRHLSWALNDRRTVQSELFRLLCTFWSFSNFYGAYQAQPPSQRRQFIQAKYRR